MSTQFSEVIPSKSNQMGDFFFVKSLKLEDLRDKVSPVAVLDKFRVTGHPFGPHPHAGFSSITYVLEDSKGSLRSRDSLGHDIIMEPGGIVWTEAGSGMMHEELPAEHGKELQGLQIFVNLSSKNKRIKPKIHKLESPEIPEWKNASKDRVRVVVGQYQNISSPLKTLEPFTFLDIELKKSIIFNLEEDCNALVLVLSGQVIINSTMGTRTLNADQGIAISTGATELKFETSQNSRMVILSGKSLNAPVVMGGSFIMNTEAEIKEAMARFQRGEMGRLNRVSDCGK